MTFRKTFLVAFFAAALVLISACGGDDDGSVSGGGGAGGGGGITPTPVSDEERAAKATVQKFYGDLFGVLSNAKQVAALQSSWTPECIRAVPLADLQRGVGEFRKANPGILEQRIDGIDFHDRMTYERTSTDGTVTIPGMRDTNLLVAGKWINAHEYFVQNGLQETSFGISTGKVAVTVVDGRHYLADCGALRYLAAFTSPTPPVVSTPSRTPTPRPGTPR